MGFPIESRAYKQRTSSKEATGLQRLHGCCKKRSFVVPATPTSINEIYRHALISD
ncbi:hypothetical protein RP20_CCG020528 [Aedes albopictus]|nr:hypothetical protein RP20_CCG020528 [Aedes albopictus]